MTHPYASPLGSIADIVAIPNSRNSDEILAFPHPKTSRQFSYSGELTSDSPAQLYSRGELTHLVDQTQEDLGVPAHIKIQAGILDAINLGSIDIPNDYYPENQALITELIQDNSDFDDMLSPTAINLDGKVVNLQLFNENLLLASDNQTNPKYELPTIDNLI